ncbi:uncharacterized protein F4812DRAFT_114031 [Daldinia caldariorum]|uniref:uncharacterized protein n=1 Tax=Daldinia caldariorum TaxID=326644 RepID=UPI0020089346|nr:uncharacterized protein F4812DRAFT_114031 [Daldinia caldariorum]KAI1465832.1 hypothetical protein F4812DRAFT_114031 [Daldinia caldariorum]
MVDLLLTKDAGNIATPTKQHDVVVNPPPVRVSLGTRLWSRLRAYISNAVDETVQSRVEGRFEKHEEWLAARLNDILENRTKADHRNRRDIFEAAWRDAALSSARFVHKHLPDAVPYYDKSETLQHALDAAPKEGLALEFGVYQGSTLRKIAASRLSGGVYGFDSFEGLPESWRCVFPAGAFALEAPPEVPGAELVVGWFDKTLGPFFAEHAGPIALLHIDSDLYSSAVTVLEHCGPRLVAGSVVIFDEYFNFPGWENDEHRAWQEYVERTGTRFSWLAFTADDEQVVVRIDDPGTQP